METVDTRHDERVELEATDDNLFQNGFIQSSELLCFDAKLKASFRKSKCYLSPNDLLSITCCSKRCTMFLSRFDIMLARTVLPLNDKNRRPVQYSLVQTCFDKSKNFIFKVAGHVVCSKLFCAIFCIGETRFSLFVNQTINGSPLQEPLRYPHRRLRPASAEVLAKLIVVLESKGQELPDSNGLVLPPGIAKREIVDAVCNVPDNDDSATTLMLKKCKCDCHTDPSKADYRYRCRCQVNLRCRCQKGVACRCRQRRSKYMKFAYYRKKLNMRMRFRRQNTFTKCNVCVKLRTAKEMAITEEERLTAMEHSNNHWDNIKANRLQSEISAQLSIIQPEKVLSLAYDGMSKYGTKIPNLLHNKKKEIKATNYVMCNNDCVYLDRPSKTTQFSLDNYLNLASAFPGGGNGATSALFQSIAACPVLPPSIIITMDNCKTNKNYNLVAACGWLLEQLKGVLHEIVIMYPEVGHTHGPVDGTFGRARGTLSQKEIKTPTAMKRLFENESGNRRVVNVLNVYDFDKLLGERANRFNMIDSAGLIRVYLQYNETNENIRIDSTEAGTATRSISSNHDTRVGVPMIQCTGFMRMNKWFNIGQPNTFAVPVFKEGQIPPLEMMPEGCIADVDKVAKLLVVRDCQGTELTKEERNDFTKTANEIVAHIPPSFATILDEMRSHCSVKHFQQKLNEVELFDVDNKLVKKYLQTRQETIQRSWLDDVESIPLDSIAGRRLTDALAKLKTPAKKSGLPPPSTDGVVVAAVKKKRGRPKKSVIPTPPSTSQPCSSNASTRQNRKRKKSLVNTTSTVASSSTVETRSMKRMKTSRDYAS